jgi:hypothetical protein
MGEASEGFSIKIQSACVPEGHNEFTAGIMFTRTMGS